MANNSLGWCFFIIFFFFIVFFILQMWQSPQNKLEKFVHLSDDIIPVSSEFIPKMFHQVWAWASKPLCENYKLWSGEIQKLHPQFLYILWDENRIMDFIKYNYSWFLPIFEQYDVKMKKIDAVRFLFLYHFGGIYMDLDSVTLKPIDDLIQNRSLLFGYAERNQKKNNAIPNCFMAVAPRHPFMKWVIEQLPKTKDLDIVHATGPNFLTHCIRQWKFDTNPNIILPMPILFTHCWYEKIENQDLDFLRNHFPTSYTTTFWSHSWK